MFLDMLVDGKKSPAFIWQLLGNLRCHKQTIATANGEVDGFPQLCFAHVGLSGGDLLIKSVFTKKNFLRCSFLYLSLREVVIFS